MSDADESQSLGQDADIVLAGDGKDLVLAWKSRRWWYGDDCANAAWRMAA